MIIALNSQKIGQVWITVIVLLLSSINARAEDRVHSLAAAFDVHCLVNSLAFDAINLVASHLHYPVHQDLGHSASTGPFLKVRSWSVATMTGPLELIASEGEGGKGHFVACSVAAADLNGDEARTGVMSALKLGAPDSVTTSSDGTKRKSIWEKFEVASLVITDASPAGRTGIIVSYESLTPKSPTH